MNENETIDSSGDISQEMEEKLEGEEYFPRIDIPVFLSPTLTSVAQESSPYHHLMPLVLPVCANCPNSAWLVMNPKSLQCFCKMSHTISWATETAMTNQLPLCDGLFLEVNEQDSEKQQQEKF